MEKQIKWIKHREDWEIHRDRFREIFDSEEDIDEEIGEDYDDGYNEDGPMPKNIMAGTPIMFPMMMQGGMQVPKSKMEKYKFMPWILLTNFEVDDNLLHKMKMFPGIETCERVSRYQYFIGIGALFCKHSIDEDENDINTWDSSELRRNFGKFLIGKESPESLEELRDKLSSENKHWAIIRFPNGSMEHVSANEITDTYNRQLQDYLETCEHTKAECFLSSE